MQREKLPTNYDESHAIEPRTDISETPQQDAELDGIDKVFDEKQPAQFANGSVSVCNRNICELVHFLSW